MIEWIQDFIQHCFMAEINITFLRLKDYCFMIKDNVAFTLNLKVNNKSIKRL